MFADVDALGTKLTKGRRVRVPGRPELVGIGDRGARVRRRLPDHRRAVPHHDHPRTTTISAP
jgi:hypothetical protein